MTAAAFTAHAVAIVGVLAASMGIAFVRLVRGPSLADRVTALDLIALIGVAAMAAAALAYDDPWFLDVGLLLALIGFVGTAAFAHYIATVEERPR